MSRPPHEFGISLLETCLVLTIIGILAALALPPLIEARSAYGLSVAVADVRTALQRARQLAIMRNQDCRLRVTSIRAYVVECDAGSWRPVRGHETPEGTTITANNAPEFHPMGNVGPMGTVTLRHLRGSTRRVIVSRSGRIRTE